MCKHYEVYWHTYYCLQRRVQNSFKRSDQVTRQPWKLPLFKTFILSNCLPLYFTVKSSRADSSLVVETLTICCMTFIVRDRSSHSVTAGAENRAVLLKLHLKSKQRREKQSLWIGLRDFFPFALPNHVYINYAASEEYKMKKGQGWFFYADEKQFRMRREGGGSWNLRGR